MPVFLTCAPPDAGDGGLDFLLEAGDQFAVGGDQRQYVAGEEGEVVLAVGLVGLGGVPQELDVFLRLWALEGAQEVIARFAKNSTWISAKPPLALVKLLKVLGRHPDLLNEVKTG